MPFGLCNAPATFQAEMNHILRPLLDKCIVLYLDDILIYSKNLKEHVEHLRKVYEIQRKNKFYVKLSKSDLALKKVQFLGYMVSAEGVHVDPRKIEAVKNWKQAMEQLQIALTTTPELILPDPDKDYVVEADASDQAVGAVLMQDHGRGLQPIAYLSKKLHGAEQNYPIHDKEAIAIVIAFKAWSCYLEGAKTSIYTDHCSLKYLKLQPMLSRRQVRWVDFLETHFQYDFYAGYFGSNKTLAGIAKYYYWPGMAANVQQFITSCNTCQQMKRLPSTSRGHEAILVVIDKFSKMGQFILTNTTATAEATMRLFFVSVITIHGIPAILISGRDPKFIIGDQVLLDTRNLDLSHLLTKLRPRFYGPFHFEAQVTRVPFHLRLPTTWKLHNAFHVQLLKPYKDPNQQFTRRQLPPPPPVLVQDEPEYEVERVLAH
ncbi:unnamed protein product, partial [Closterium sp. NIES-53]